MLRRTLHSNFKIQVLSRDAHSLLSVPSSLQSGATNVSRARAARGRSLIKLLKDFRRRPRRGPALRFVDSGRTSGSTSYRLSHLHSLILSGVPIYSASRRSRFFPRSLPVAALGKLHSLHSLHLARRADSETRETRGARIAFREIESRSESAGGLSSNTADTSRDDGSHFGFLFRDAAPECLCVRL